MIMEVYADTFMDAVLRMPICNFDSNEDSDIAFVIRLDKMKSLLASQKALLIVHDYNNEEGESARWRELPCDILITCQTDRHDEGYQIDLLPESLSVEEGMNILKQNYLLAALDVPDKVVIDEMAGLFDREMDSVRGIVELVNRHPLCLSLIGRQMAYDEEKSVSPKEMLKELKEKESKQASDVGLLRADVSVKPTRGRDLTVREHLLAIFQVAIDHGRLGEEELAALRYMRLVSPVYGICRERFIFWTGFKYTESILKRLVKLGWLVYDPSKNDPIEAWYDEGVGVYYMPAVIEECLSEHKKMILEYEDVKSFIEEFQRLNIRYMTSAARRYSCLEQLLTVGLRFGDDYQGISDLPVLYHCGINCIERNNGIRIIKLGLEYLEKALVIRRYNYWGIDDIPLEAIYQNAGIALQNLGDIEKALQYHEKALETRRIFVGENHVDIARCYNYIGECLAEHVDIKRGLECYRKALDIYLSVLGENHTDTADSYYRVGILLVKLGNIKEGIEYQERALDIYRSVLGENHAETASIFDKVGISLERQGNIKKGLLYLEKALEIRRSLLSEYHTDLARSYSHVGYSLVKSGNQKKGLEYQEKVLEIRRSTLGEYNADTASSYHNLAANYKNMGRIEDAFMYYQNAYEIRRFVLGETVQDTIMSKNCMEECKALLKLESDF